MTRRIVVHVLMLLVFLPLSLKAAASPDELYGQGRYGEARKGYERLDMDNPSDLKFRYNRGCAAFQEGKFDEAKAAFSSVVRRSQDDDMRFRALYNLGNTAFKENDYPSARDHYRDALKVRPDDPDARHNLELALKALKKQQSSKDRQKGNDQQKKEEQQKDSQQKDGKGQQGGRNDQGKGQGDKQESGKSKQQDQQQGNKNGSQGRQPGHQPSQNQDDYAGGRSGRDEGRQDLSGELKGRNTAQEPGTNSQGRQENSAAAMERQKASALLDNIKEDRSRFNVTRGIQGGSMSTGSGKEW